jgi:hypothetical protein
MMDATDLIPGGFHPRLHDRSPDFSRRLKTRKRSSLKTPVRYYFIDFGLSSWFRKADSDGTESHTQVDKSLRRLVTGNKCQDPNVAEMYSQRPHDPFVLDIGILGNVFDRTLIYVRPFALRYLRRSHSWQRYPNLNFLFPLTNRMTLPWPDRRPSEEEVLRQFNECVESVSPAALRWRLKLWNEKPLPAALRDIRSATAEVKYQIMWLTRESSPASPALM